MQLFTKLLSSINHPIRNCLIAIAFAVALVSCGGGSSGSSSTPAPTPVTTTYTIGGSVSGLNGSLTLKNNLTEELVVTSNGPFTFIAPVNEGGQYNLSITTQPSTQTCSRSNYFGTDVNSNVTTVLISCTDNPPGTTSLSLSTTSLALAASGSSRVIIVSNTGQVAALSLSILASPVFPSGTTSASTCSSTLPAGSSCTITITPGPTASASASVGSAAVPSTLAITGANTNSLDANVYVLTYGSIYQSGFIFSIDDSTASTNNIGGKVLSLLDQSSSSNWSVTTVDIPGISEIDTTPCDGASDGACNTSQIVSYYSTPYSSYAAGLCKSTINGYGDWFLPSICELNKAPPYTPRICNQATQDIQSNLVDTNIVPLNGYYWSSTEYSLFPQNFAWINWFASGGGSAPLLTNKIFLQSVRCTRSLTN